jgi:GNAT superfamily N-acetyltransferase
MGQYSGMTPEEPGKATIRAARPGELLLLIAIERAAGESFRSLGMDLVADDEPRTAEELQPYVEDGRVLVSVDAADRPTGYLLLDKVDGAAYIEQVSVHPAHARQGIGRALIEQAAAWARCQDLDSLTLTTYVDVPWNGPYYERLGFRYLTPDELTPRLRAIRDHERASGLDTWPRAGMRLSLQPSDATGIRAY